MGKELIISSDRHETKVAVLEDDQLVEVFFQRANEYSLAGSIHKGRVTRVLPGMQSAFVDLGLERDTFLYVSDFFEENEEYDPIPAGGEERGYRPERPERPDRGERFERPERAERPERVAADRPERAADRPEPAGRSEPGIGMAAAATPPATPVDIRPPQPASGPIDEQDSRDRRGRRSRRRRNRGRGFPESKYAEVPAPRQAAPVSSVSEEEEFPVLPGETLAKYRGVDVKRAVEAVDAGLPAASDDVPEPDVPETQSGGHESLLASTVSAAEPDEEGDEDLVAAPALDDEDEAEPQELSPDVEDADPDVEPVRPEDSPSGPRADQSDVAPPQAEADLELEALPALEPEPDPDPDGDVEQFAADVEAEEGAESEAAAEAEAEAGAEPGEDPNRETGIEPARIPQSLTATLREQGGRYLHRTARPRMRRKSGGRWHEQDRRPEHEAKPQEHAPRSEGPRPVARPERGQPASITELLKEGQEILVQIAKEPLGQKGARITSHIALPGRYVVYMPTVEHMGVSRKIASDEERLRLKRILQTHRAGIAGGFIVRTAGEGKTEDEIANDMSYLSNLWLDIRQKAEKRPAPALIHHDLEIVQRILRDQLTDEFKAIWTDSEEIYESVLRFAQRFQPSLLGRVKMYTRDTPIFDAFNITAELEKALRPKVWLKSGGYIVINQTEALVAIDVNTGKFVGKSNRLEDTIVKTNIEAVREIVRQMRLRDLGGIIVVDFIDMDERKNRQKVMQALEEGMRMDRAPYKVLSFNDFGLVAITRKRVKQSLERTLCSPCPYCEGAGYIKSVQTVIGEILQEAHKIARLVEGGDMVLRVSTDVAKLFKSTDNHYLEELEEIVGRPVAVIGDPLLHNEKFDLT